LGQAEGLSDQLVPDRRVACVGLQGGKPPEGSDGVGVGRLAQHCQPLFERGAGRFVPSEPAQGGTFEAACPGGRPTLTQPLPGFPGSLGLFDGPHVLAGVEAGAGRVFPQPPACSGWATAAAWV
jgi:hypothetical protein